MDSKLERIKVKLNQTSWNLARQETLLGFIDDIEWLTITVERQRKSLEKIAEKQHWSDCVRIAREELKNEI